MELKQGFYRISIMDNVATALADVPAGSWEVFGALDSTIHVQHFIPFGHKVALRPVAKDDEIIKYGYVIGIAMQDIPEGACVDSRNCTSRIGVTEGEGVYRPGTRTQYTLAEYHRVRRDDLNDIDKTQ
jgi:hypothetical protein